MRNAFQPRHLLSASVGVAAFVLLTGLSYRLAAQAPALSFEAVEGEVWQQLPAVGRGLDTYEHPITTDPFFSDPTGTSGIWPCDTSNGFVSRCYPSGAVGVGDSVFPSPIQLQGLIVSCDRDTNSCYPNGRAKPSIPLTDGYGPCTIQSYSLTQTDCYPSLQVGVGARVPPAPGQLAVAQMVAVDNATGDLYVTDHWNHRVQVFRFDGSVAQLAHPIGNGIARRGSFSYDVTAGATTTYTGESLAFPEGIKIDAARHIVVGDSVNGRVVAFDRSGQYLDELHIPAQTDGTPGRPSGIALSAGAAFKGASNPAGSRLVVTDKYACTAYIYDATTLDFAGRGQIGFGNCNNTGDALQPPDSQSLLGAAIDAGGHIYLADYDRNRIEIFDADGNFLAAFGEPPLTGPTPPGALNGPTDVLIDHRGRVVVSDSLNQRLAVYRLSFSASAPSAVFLFALNAAGNLNGTPNGVAEDLFNDASGRLVATDSVNQRVQRFQLPDLGIVRAQGNGASNSVSFTVTVPDTKAGSVASATPIICSTTAGITVQAGAAPAGVVCDSGTAYALPAATLAPGQLAPYSFTFSGAPAPATFQIFAVGNPDPAHANAFLTTTSVTTVTVARTCANCSIAAEVKLPSNLTEPLVPPVAPSTLYVGQHPYPSAVSLHVTATHPAGLKEFQYRFVTGAETSMSGQPGTRPPFPVSGRTASFDIPFELQGSSTVEYWAVGLDGSEGAHQQAQLRISFNAPFLAFSFASASASPNGAGWYRAPFSVPLMFGTGHIVSVTPTPTRPASPLFFDREGSNVFFSVTVRDAANLFDPLTLMSNDADNSGQTIKLDMTAPQFPASASITLERGSYLGAPASALPSYLVHLAVDPVLADGTQGSGVVTVVPAPGQPAFYPFPTSQQRFTATDLADNVGTGVVTIVVADTVAPVLSCPATAAIPAGPLGRVFSLPGFSVFDASMIDAPPSQPQVAVTQTPAWPTILNANASLDVVLTATDLSGNRGTCTTRVTASLGSAVHFTKVPGDQTVEGIGPGSVTQPAIDLVATAVDATGAPATITLTPPAPAKLPVGSTTITFTAKDGANHTTSMPVVITVTDRTAPKLSACPVAPAPIVLANGVVPSIPNLAAAVTATDYSSFSITQAPAAGTVYPLPAGQNSLTVPVTVQATDALQNASACAPVAVTFRRPTQPPVLAQADIVTYATSTTGAVVTFTPSVIDAIDGTNHTPVSCTPKSSGATFAIGTTTEICSATNSAGLTGSVTFKVTVRHSAPVCAAAAADPGSLWPPNHKFVPIGIGGVTTADRGTSAITVTSVFQDEPTNGLGDGDTAIDAVLVNGGAQVRAERDGGGDGRVYYINFRATTDGGSCTGTVTVGVQHDEGKRTAVGQGPKFDSTVATTPEKTDKGDKKDDDEKKDKK